MEAKHTEKGQPKNSKGAKFNFNLTDDVAKAIKRIQRVFGLMYKSEAFRFALSIADTIAEAIAKGHRVIIEDAEGNPLSEIRPVFKSVVVPISHRPTSSAQLDAEKE